MELIKIFCTLAVLGLTSAQITVKSSIGGGNEVFDGYVSYSIEFSSFPDFAGKSGRIDVLSGFLTGHRE